MSQQAAILRIPIGVVPAGGARLRLPEVPFTEESFTIHAFLDLPDDEFHSAGPQHRRRVGLFAMYGFGGPLPPDRRGMTFPFVLDVPPKLAMTTTRRSEIVLIVKDFSGHRMEPPAGWQPSPIFVEPIIT